MRLFDTLAFDADSKPRKTGNGYLVASVLAARTGIQIYSGDEVGKPEKKTVRVYRAPEEVFATDSLHSYGHIPLTSDHPDEFVTADNWSDLSIGHVGGDFIAKDGEYVRVPMLLMDGKAISEFEDGKRELSLGYTVDLEWTPGVVPAGQRDGGLPYDAKQKNIRANHLAVVDRARGGPDLKIGDDDEMANDPVKTRNVIVDGLPIEATDASAIAIDKLIGDRFKLQTALDTVTKAKDEAVAALSAKDGEIAVLKKAVDDAKMTDAQIDAAAERKAVTIATVKKIMGDAFDVKGKSEADLKLAVVNAKLGDAAKALDPAGIAGAFAALVSQAGGPAPGGTPQADALREGIRQAAPNQNSADAWRKANDAERNAWKTPQAA